MTCEKSVNMDILSTVVESEAVWWCGMEFKKSPGKLSAGQILDFEGFVAEVFGEKA